MIRFLKNLFVIRRPEFMIVEATIFSMPILVAAGGVERVANKVVLEGLLLFFVLYSLGDMINCLADRDLDSIYKTRLSSAVYGLGVGFVRKLVLAEGVAAFLLGVRLAWISGQWLLFALVLGGIFLGVEYSIGPFYFKSRGVGHVVCLWLLLFFLPMLYAAMLVSSALTPVVVLMAAAYSTIEMGIILINTSEDLPEDRAMGVRTTTVSLGLARTLKLSALMVLSGGGVLIAVWLYLFQQIRTSILAYGALAGLVGAWAYVFQSIFGLALRVGKSEEQPGVVMVKAHGAKVPVWATAVGWMSVMCGIAYFFGRHHRA